MPQGAQHPSASSSQRQEKTRNRSKESISNSTPHKPLQTCDNVEYAILLMGVTGAGKSTFVKHATGCSVRIGHSLEPCTSKPEAYDMVCKNGRRISLVDTPGFNDKNRADTEVLESIMQYVTTRKQRILAVIYLHRIVDKRVTGSTLLNLRVLGAICGEHFFQNIIIITSMWSLVSRNPDDLALRRETELCKPEGGLWGYMQLKGAKYERWDDQPNPYPHSKAAIDIVGICNIWAEVPRLQIELEMHQGRSVQETSAGRILTTELRKRQEKERMALEEEENERRAMEQEISALQARAQNVARGPPKRERQAALAARRAYAIRLLRLW